MWIELKFEYNKKFKKSNLYEDAPVEVYIEQRNYCKEIKILKILKSSIKSYFE